MAGRSCFAESKTGAATPLLPPPVPATASTAGRSIQSLRSPDPANYPEEYYGIEDPRITYVAELKKYAIVYTAFASSALRVDALTEDFKQFERLGCILPPENKDAALFPRRSAKTGR